MSVRAVVFASLAAVVAIACEGEVTGGPGDGMGGGGAGAEFTAARKQCVDRINMYRAGEGKPALKLWDGDGSRCADSQAQKDADKNKAHGSFGLCGESAQNTCPRWPSVDAVVTNCLQQMWAEGPGSFPEHGHYMNMSSTSYTEVSCGFYVMSSGQVWASQNFR